MAVEPSPAAAGEPGSPRPRLNDMSRPLWLVIAALLLSPSCGGRVGGDSGGDNGTAADATVRGVVVLGPTCPVEIEPVPGSTAPPDQRGAPAIPSCAPRPVEATVRAFRAGSDDVVASTRSAPDGRFEWQLPAGNYVLQAVATSGIAHGVPLDVSLTTGAEQEVVLRLDSGIR